MAEKLTEEDFLKMSASVRVIEHCPKAAQEMVEASAAFDEGRGLFDPESQPWAIKRL